LRISALWTRASGGLQESLSSHWLANYRLGSLGYLRLPDIGADNVGVRDRAAAIQWVRDNVAAFGGDAGRITVGGQSAGAFSAPYLALAPRTSGFIRRIICQSVPFGRAAL
jgi:para-nitrobenzyl esterase